MENGFEGEKRKAYTLTGRASLDVAPQRSLNRGRRRGGGKDTSLLEAKLLTGNDIKDSDFSLKRTQHICTFNRTKRFGDFKELTEMIKI